MSVGNFLYLLTQELEHVKSKLPCFEHQLGDSELENTATFCWVDVSQLNAPHYPLCTQDLQEWAKHLYDTRDSYNACATLPNTPHFDDVHKTHKERSSLQCVPTERISPVIHNHVHISSATNNSGIWSSNDVEGPKALTPQPLKRTFALFMESDEETDDEPLQDIEAVLTSINSCYPAMNFPKYVNTLKERGIFYLSTAAHFNSQFYVEKVGMSEGAAFTFHTGICKAHMKDERRKARRKAKGKKKA
ncbi:hypothetical protein C8R48DRAFT_679784 [Suillus tomentosus]|nr:hypothetical protein C8R48DRAFT_679784 [Suillus tomentosus]